MKAAVIERPGRLVIKDVPRPVCGDNDIVIKVRSASICNSTDHHIYEGTFTGYHDYYPQILCYGILQNNGYNHSQVNRCLQDSKLLHYQKMSKPEMSLQQKALC
jgi:hypothetical protein